MKDGKETKNKNHCPGKHTIEYWQREMSENTQQKKQSTREKRFKFPAIHLQKMENLKRLLVEWRS